MDFLWEGVGEAVRLVLAGDPLVLHAVWVSVLCTGSAVLIASLLAIPYGAALALFPIPLRGVQTGLLRVGMFVPTVVVGLLVYGLLSRRGPLGPLDLLYSKPAVIAGEVLLAFPVLGALTQAAAASLDTTVFETAKTLGAGPLRTIGMVLGEVRRPVVAAILAAWARCFSELGVAVTVGGNLERKTRTLASTVVLELGKGNFAAALAPGLILLVLAAVIAVLAHRFSHEEKA